MRLSYQIVIIAFVLLSLFVIRDDVRDLYDRLTSPNLSTFIRPSGSGSAITEQPSVSIKIPVETPGPLRALDTLIEGQVAGSLSVKAIVESTNQSRVANGNLPPLVSNPSLDKSAAKKVADMFAKQYFEHVSPSGKSVVNLARGVSYDYILIGENLALGNFKNEKELVAAWMASPGHRANILNKRYTEIGVAVGRGMFEGRNVWLAVQHFALPRSACPAVDETLRVSITGLDKEIKTMGDDLAVRHERIASGAVYNGMTTNEQIKEYNALTVTYNQLVTTLKEKITTYNTQIKSFNACLTGNT